MSLTRAFLACVVCAACLSAVAGLADAADDASRLRADVDRLTVAVQPRVVTWRRDFHQHPELGNR